MTTPPDRIQHYLLVFDHEQGKLIETIEFGRDADAAVEAYASKETEFGDRTGSKSWSSARTRSRPSRGPTRTTTAGSSIASKYLAGI